MFKDDETQEDFRAVSQEAADRFATERASLGDDLAVLFGEFITEAKPVRELSKDFGMVSTMELFAIAMYPRADDFTIAQAMREIQKRYLASPLVRDWIEAEVSEALA